MKKRKFVRNLSKGLILSVATLCGESLLNVQQSKADTRTSMNGSTLRIVYNGRGKVNLLNSKFKYQNQYVANGTNWKVWEKLVSNQGTLYRIGNENQWVPEQYTDKKSTTQAPKKPTTNTNNNVQAKTILPTANVVKIKAATGANVYTAPVNGRYVKHLNPNTSWKYFKIEHGNDGYAWFNLGGAQWISSKLTDQPQIVKNISHITQAPKTVKKAKTISQAKATYNPVQNLANIYIPKHVYIPKHNNMSIYDMGLNNGPVNIDSAISFMRQLKNNGVQYSMFGKRDGSDGTADCSGAVYAALRAGGASSLGYIPNTDSMHNWLLKNNFTEVAHSTRIPNQKGDVVIFGAKGLSGGAAGHVVLYTSPYTIIHCTDRDDSHSGVLEEPASNIEGCYTSMGGFYVYRQI